MNLVDNCMECKKNHPAPFKEPLLPTEMPTRPWERVSADLCEHEGKTYLIVIDQCSHLSEIKSLTSTTASVVISNMKDILATHGVMDTLKSNNEPQFVSLQFKEFARHFKSPFPPSKW